MRTTRTSDRPLHAPDGFRDLPERVVTSDGAGQWLTWHGPGEPTAEPCGACGGRDGNLRIYANWGCSYPNGNAWDDREILCGACGRFTTTYDFTEG